MPPRIQLTAAQKQALVLRHRERLSQCEPWSSAMAWKPELNIQGATYKVLELYKDQDALSAHGASDHFKAAGPKWGPVLAGRPEVEYLDGVG